MLCIGGGFFLNYCLATGLINMTRGAKFVERFYKTDKFSQVREYHRIERPGFEAIVLANVHQQVPQNGSANTTLPPSMPADAVVGIWAGWPLIRL